MSFSFDKRFYYRQAINSLRIFVADARVVSQSSSVSGVHLGSQQMEGIVNYVGHRSTVRGVEANTDGLLEVDVHFPIDDLTGLDDVGGVQSNVEIRNLEHLILEDSEAPEVLRVLKAVDLRTAVGNGRAHQIFALHRRRIGLHVLNENKPNLGARISIDLGRLRWYIDHTMDLNLADLDLATDSVIEGCSSDWGTQVERVRNGGRAEIDSRGGVNFGVSPVSRDSLDSSGTKVTIHVLHLRVNLTAAGASNTPLGKKVLLACGYLTASPFARLLVRWERTSSTSLHFHENVLAYWKAKFLIRKVGLVRIGALLLWGRGLAHREPVSVSLGDYLITELSWWPVILVKRRLSPPFDGHQPKFSRGPNVGSKVPLEVSALG